MINAASGVGRIDVLVNSIVALDRVGVGARSDLLPLDRGTYEIRINAANDVDTLLGPVTVRLEAGRSYTLVLMGRAGSGALTLETYSDH